ncbi:cytochrome b/b6 domain-containing protein [Hasllibacter sp. MH4015]|uniref:cytochrome b/b6 domain-containing protein n=1 Tax=Hasllibacter sp. MH4015 TaxID=2854029 RepID=UPI001CD7A6C0|nr:cytochrome b/b6 domain-containing protein [Hasllibacter sp. MH4015]
MTDATALPLRLPRPRLPARRTMLKALHWGIVPFFIWFMFADPDVLRRMGRGWFQLHSINGLIFVTLALIWTGDHLRRGLASRPGPKLPPWARRVHPILHKTLIWGLFLVALTGFGLGATSAVLLRAGGFLPIAPPLDLPQAHAMVSFVHVYQFYALAGIVALHATFHIWRHVHLRDNALRIMVPRLLHRFL